MYILDLNLKKILSC